MNPVHSFYYFLLLSQIRKALDTVKLSSPGLGGSPSAFSSNQPMSGTGEHWGLARVEEYGEREQVRQHRKDGSTDLSEGPPVQVGAANVEMLLIHQPELGVQDASTNQSCEVQRAHFSVTCRRWFGLKTILFIHHNRKLNKNKYRKHKSSMLICVLPTDKMKVVYSQLSADYRILTSCLLHRVTREESNSSPK